MFGIVHTFHARIQAGGRESSSLENQKNIGFHSNTDPDPLKITNVPSLHCDVYFNTDWQFEMFKRGKANGHDTCLCIFQNRFPLVQ